MNENENEGGEETFREVGCRKREGDREGGRGGNEKDSEG